MTRALQGLLAGAPPSSAGLIGPAPAKLNVSDVAVIDSNGNATCSLQPPDRHVWRDVVIAILVTVPSNPALIVANPKTPAANYYIGRQPVPANLIDTTTMGNRNSSGRGAAYPISGDELVWVVWSGGQPNYNVTLSVFGNEYTQ